MSLKRFYLAGTLFAIGFTSLTVLSQSTAKEKPKLKNFGESLKRLNWDPQLNAAVETKLANKAVKVGDGEDVVKVETSLVVSDVLVLDQRGQAVTGLTANDFVITEEGKPQKVELFSLGDNVNVPRSIVLIIDYSISQSPYIRTSVGAAQTLVDKLAPLDRMAIVTDDVELLVDFTDDKKKLKDGLKSLLNRIERGSGPIGRPRFGRSQQYSALMATLKEAFDAEDQRPIVIFQTDGDQVTLLRDPKIIPAVPPDLPNDLRQMDERRVEAWRERVKREQTEFSLNDLYKTVEKSRATIYTVVPGFRMVGLSPDEQLAQFKAQRAYDAIAASMMINVQLGPHHQKQQADRWKRTPPQALQSYVDEAVKVQASLAVVATLTGAWTEFLEQASQADEIYSNIFSDINRRYVVGYYPTDKEHDGKRRRLSIEVKGHPEYTVLSRKSYYAPGPE
jgi:VWFA-related protein